MAQKGTNGPQQNPSRTMVDHSTIHINRVMPLAA
jgi:hypothetical protein